VLQTYRIKVDYRRTIRGDRVGLLWRFINAPRRELAQEVTWQGIGIVASLGTTSEPIRPR
jgi:hypothetical protein